MGESGEMRRRGVLVGSHFGFGLGETMNVDPDRKEAWPAGGPFHPKGISRRKGNLFKKIAEMSIEYTETSSMHGLKYIGDRRLSAPERYFWIFAFLAAAAASIYFITNLFDKFEQMPVITSLSPMPSSIKDVPFPAITICNMNNMRKDQAERVFDAYQNDEEDREAQLDRKLIFDFCSREPPPNDKPTTVRMANISSNFEYIKKFMTKMTQPCHELLVYCTWHGDRMSCEDLFNPNLTDEGMCCVFNRLKREHIFRNPRNVSDLNVTFPDDAYDWSPEKSFADNIKEDSIPRRPRGSGTHLGLTVVVNAELERYYCSSENSEGFKILLNNPLETPKVSSFALSVEPSRETKVVIVPKLVTATSQLRSIPIKKRMCYFEDEKQLYFYTTYNQRSCILECEANFTLALCKCVEYYMPKDTKTRICGRDDMPCAKDAQKQMEMSLDGAILNLSTKTNTNLNLCDCKPACNEVSYGFVVTQSPISSSLEINKDYYRDFNESYFKTNMAIIHFFYMEIQFTSTVRGVLFGFTEFLSNTGGLLGLFLGFSFLSAVELVFFVIMKIFYWFRKPKKSAEKNLEKSTVFVTSTRKEQGADEPTLLIKNPFPFAQ